MGDSKELWLKVHGQMNEFDVKLGKALAQIYVHDPKALAFISSRYKFVAKMLDGKKRVLEVGCGDGFGAPIVSQHVGQMLCTDIDEATLKNNRERLSLFENICFKYHDFRKGPIDEPLDAVYMVDVSEHVFPAEEKELMENIVASLTDVGVAVIGTPNKTAEVYASANSRLGHVNLKDHQSLREMAERYFHSVFLCGMNDEVVHTGFAPMAHYLWVLCSHPKRG